MFRLLAMLLVLAGMIAAPVALQAEEAKTRVMVPDSPNGAYVDGCYRADRGLYGPYRLTFCLQRKGTYAIRATGVACDGRLTWRAEGRDVFIDLKRQSCHNGQAWSAGSISCRPRSLLDLILSELLDKQTDPKTGRVMVPDTPQVRQMRCTYLPSVPGKPRLTFVAKHL